MGRLENFGILIGEMTNKELQEALTMLEKEIRLSNTAIKEGFEKRK